MDACQLNQGASAIAVCEVVSTWNLKLECASQAWAWCDVLSIDDRSASCNRGDSSCLIECIASEN